MIKFSEPKLYKRESKEILDKIFNNKWVTQGNYTSIFENKTKNMMNFKNFILMSNCTCSLQICLEVLDIKEKDEVLIPSFTWISTVNAVLAVGANPKFIDIDLNTLNVAYSEIIKNISSKTKAIIIVHQFGNPFPKKIMNRIKRKFKIHIIEDAACAFGSKYEDGTFVGYSDNLVCFSFHPRKIITTGEGGAIASNKSKYFKKIKLLINHGHHKTKNSDYFPMMGYNYRISDIQVAIGLPQLYKIKKLIKERQKLASYYINNLKNNTNIEFQKIENGTESNLQSFIIKIKEKIIKNKILKILQKNNISVRDNYYLCHEQPFLKKIKKSNLVNSNKILNEIIFLPMHNNLHKEDISLICNVINEVSFTKK